RGPDPANGSAEGSVSGWMKRSYRMPSTREITSTARMSRNTSPVWLDWNAWAVPPNEVVTLEGSTCRATRCTAATAVPSDTFGWRSNEIVTDGNCPEWLTVSGPTV